MRRTLWSCDILYSGRGMDGRRPDPEGFLVSSLCESGLHAPVLDCDYPVETIGIAPRRIRLFPYETSFDSAGIPALAAVLRVHKIGDVLRVVEPGMIDEGQVDVRLDVPYQLHPSSTLGHWHLYLDVELPWQACAELMVALEDAGLLNPGYVENSLPREMMMVIRPGITKKELSKRGVRIEDGGS